MRDVDFEALFRDRTSSVWNVPVSGPGLSRCTIVIGYQMVVDSVTGCVQRSGTNTRDLNAQCSEFGRKINIRTQKDHRSFNNRLLRTCYRYSKMFCRYSIATQTDCWSSPAYCRAGVNNLQPVTSTKRSARNLLADSLEECSASVVKTCCFYRSIHQIECSMKNTGQELLGKTSISSVDQSFNVVASPRVYQSVSQAPRTHHTKSPPAQGFQSVLFRTILSSRASGSSACGRLTSSAAAAAWSHPSCHPTVRMKVSNAFIIAYGRDKLTKLPI